MGRCGSKNGHQIDICFNEIGFCVQRKLTFVILVVNMVGRTHVVT